MSMLCVSRNLKPKPKFELYLHNTCILYINVQLGQTLTLTPLNSAELKQTKFKSLS